jgi:alkylation response protein AidB-like acyl-CoA dehydrogenase
MLIELTDEQKMVRDMVRDFAQNEVAPVAAKIDETGEFPWEVVKKMGELGLMGIPFPEKWGGSGFGELTYAIAVEEIAKVCASTAITLAAHTSIGTAPIYLFGTEEQKERFLIPLAKGEKIGAFAMTEPNAGSDVGSIESTAVRDGDSYVLNGSKMFCTNAGVADVLVVAARIGNGKGIDGITIFLVEKDTPGLKMGKKENKMGWRGSDTRQFTMEDALVPAGNLLGVEGEGFKQNMETLEGGRISIAALSLGIAEAALEASLSYASQRKQFGRTIGHFQAIRFKIADMVTGIEAGRLLTYNAAARRDNGLPHGLEAALAKLFCSELATKSALEAIQIHGGYGYIKEYPVERYLRDAKVCEIGEGTSEIQRIVIARQVMGRED